ncbi:hypothetical protein ATCC90586_011226 [Pythium insidiosum]|nr:hypothetical protein ATCC90586_011226 [Pythium insidiosum]
MVLRSSIGSIISKPQWWLKWRGVLPAKRSGDGTDVNKTIADKWLDEVVTAVLENRFYWMTKHRYTWMCDKAMLLQRVVGYPPPETADREAKLL